MMMKLVGTLAAVAVVGIAVETASAQSVTLQRGNSVVNFELSGTDPADIGMRDWYVDGVDHLHQQWFWVRLASDNEQHALGTASVPYQSHSVADFGVGGPGDNLLESVYDYLGLEINVRYSLVAGSIGSAFSDVAEQISITNTTLAPVSFVFYQYSDFDLNGTAGDDTVEITGGNTARQYDGSIFASETVVTPLPTGVETAFYSDTLDKLTGASAAVLDGDTGPKGPNDVTWAFSWSATLAPGGTYLISKDKQIQPIPEPASLSLLALGGLALLRRRR